MFFNDHCKLRRSFGMIILSACLVALAVLTGCNQIGSHGSASSPPNATSPSDGEGEAQTGTVQAERNIQHAMGDTVVAGTPTKVVTLFQGATDAALALGVKPAGAVEAWIEQPWYNYIRDQMDGVVNLGSENQPNLEEIAALKPDVIIASKTRHEEIYSQLSGIAPTVMTEEVHIWKESLALTAEALNKKQEEQVFLQRWEGEVADFREKMGDKLKMEVGILDFRADHARIVHTGFSALVLDELGITRPMEQKGEEWGVKLVSKENIPQMDADILFDQTSTSREDGRLDLRKEWTEHPLWKNLRAVQNNRVYEVDTAVWNNGSGPLAAEQMLIDLKEIYELE
ncbi:ABC transporter substrate-binding protein [Paenibacillus lautus]|uniref:ABC transporter substrate-binding protein n=1 Tax=Paenibacillus lautus TaxID=1401 RepID=UPI001C7D028F|nr:iron-siderophore ABC transporter substrate-binding protein [Paenibacillus lautus]MBX4149094.1 iron-siderophore ABC transporter substrate-binding protein [Paenibacillus lautus]